MFAKALADKSSTAKTLVFVYELTLILVERKDLLLHKDW